MSHAALPEFGISKNIKQVGRTDLPEGGLVITLSYSHISPYQLP